MIVQGLTDAFRYGLLTGRVDFSTQAFRLALYTGDAELGPGTSVYTTEHEVTGGGYAAGGMPLVTLGPSLDEGRHVAFVSFEDVTWANVTFSAAGALIYNANDGSAACVLNFGGVKTATPAGTFTVIFPPATATSAVIRIE